MWQDITLQDVLIVSTLMFFSGVYGFLTRRNLITMLMSVELMLNAVNINFVAFNYFLHPENMHGMFFALFVVVIAAAEASVAIAIIIGIYRRFKSINIEDVSNMKY
ncbi:MAG: NADH-quinone oxidoreductase subunit NuoK [Bacteroidales bacterium]|jgi:NADH-quinone oxidoreductase subunit K|nr:NADH-quinone oxidoreductase subunit NuoK [Bacteroidales bacterium]NPV36917.1 NADH-quinone oxidoreductase subunit NuoK [Bacteroidales bacterium]